MLRLSSRFEKIRMNNFIGNIPSAKYGNLICFVSKIMYYYGQGYVK
jgi:hypothetical protein